MPETVIDSQSRLHRSMLYVPGDDERKLEKATTMLVADVLIADLEDAVPPARKDLARNLVTEALRVELRPGTRRYVRINPATGPDWQADVERTLDADPDGFVIPKVEGPEDVRRVVEFLAALGATDSSATPSLAAIVTESAKGFMNAAAAIAASDLVRDVLWGAEDLAADIAASVSRDAAGRYVSPFDHVRAQILLQSKALGRRAIDAPFLRLADPDGLRREAREAAAMGFDGKQAIHPEHVPVIHEEFQPSDEEVVRARELVAAFDDASQGAFAFEGEMVDPPHLKAARRTLALAQRAPAPERSESPDYPTEGA